MIAAFSFAAATALWACASLVLWYVRRQGLRGVLVPQDLPAGHRGAYSLAGLRGLGAWALVLAAVQLVVVGTVALWYPLPAAVLLWLAGMLVFRTAARTSDVISDRGGRVIPW